MRRLPAPFDLSGVPGIPRLPELPSRRQVASVLRALTDVEPVIECVQGHREPPDRVPPLRLTPPVIAKLLFDEWALQLETARSRLRVPTTDFRRRLRSELTDALDLFESRGWILHPRSYHQDPPGLPMEAVTVNQVGWGRSAYEHARWASEWEPWPDEPGRDRWLEYRRNQTAHAWLLRHDDGPRPWILCINGYRSGEPLVDLMSFRATHLHRRLGLNVAVLVQPLHGPRSAGSVSGDRVVYGGAMNLTHTIAQAVWDARRLLSWLRAVQGAPQVGVMGLSLGGFVVGLLAALDGDLACVVAGIPESDFVRNLRRTVEPLLPPFYEQWGLSWTPSERVAKVVSPLAMNPQVPVNRRFIFAGLADRWVRPGNIVALWEHWERCEIRWYQGSHLSSFTERSVRNFVDEVLVRMLAG